MNDVRLLAIVAFVGVGLFFTLVSTVGVLRLPDLYSRAHTASQADTLGAGFALAGVAIAIGLEPTAIKTVLLLFFIFVTNPTAAHAIARAADEEGIVPWTVDDDRTDDDLYEEAEHRRSGGRANEIGSRSSGDAAGPTDGAGEPTGPTDATGGEP